VRIRAPAKINLFLRVVGKRKDGYHRLDTLMAPVSLYDEIEIRKSRRAPRSAAPRIAVGCAHPLVPPGEKNLAFRAARLLLPRIDPRWAVRIGIRKRIPVGAGLGGGSADAAATLTGLNRLFRLGLTDAQLEKLALALGADVPFFVRARPARARGIGERLSPVGKLPALWLVILYPGFPVSTARVFRKLPALTKTRVNTSIATSLKSPDTIASLLLNDLETVAFNLYPGIRLLKNKLLREGAAGGLMSGSGSAVFGIFRSKKMAEKAYLRLRKEEGVDAFLVRVLN